MNSGASSPRLASLGGFFGAGANMDSSNRFIAKSRGWNFDDSSSISSMSSFSRGVLCHVCKEAETLPIKPLVRCKTCKGSWHPCCHKPNIDDPKKEGFQCAKCTRKMNATSNPLPMPVPSTGYTLPPPNPNSESLEEPNKITARYVCQKQGCSAPIFQTGSNAQVLCKRHEMEEKHRSATTQKQGGFRVSTVSKPFKKKKLYPVKPDEDMKMAKRKRSSSGKRNVSHDGTEVPTIDRQLQPRFQNTGLQGFGNPLVPDGQSNDPSQRRALEGRTRSITTQNVFPIGEKLSRDLGYTNVAGSPMETRISKLGTSDLMYPSADRTLVEGPSTLPQHEPPPPPRPHGLTSPLETRRSSNDSPGSQIAHELRAAVDRSPENMDLDNIQEPTKTIRVSELNHLQRQGVEMKRSEQSGLKIAEALIAPYIERAQRPHYQTPYPPIQPTSRRIQEVDREVTVPNQIPGHPRKLENTAKGFWKIVRNDISEENADATGAAEKALGQNTETTGIPRLEMSVASSHSPDTTMAEGVSRAQDEVPTPLRPGSPARTSVSSSTTPREEVILGDSNSEEISSTTLLEPLEAKRQQRAEAYDSSALDSWLKTQSLPEPEYPPTSEELAKTQMWGHIDPRIKWPKDHSERWLTEKRKEIEARGGRKASFGRLLTAQVVKERRERGWGIHQNKDVVEDERSVEGARVLEELFGVRGIDNFEPGVRDGQLIMMERAVRENGKKKRKPRIYAVG